MKKFLEFVFLSVLSSSFLFAQTVDAKSLVSSSVYEELTKKGVVIQQRDDGSSKLNLLPKTEWDSEIKKSLITKENGNYPYTYESLYLLSKKEILKASNSSKNDISIDDIAKVCRSISKMQGMTYYSTTRKKEMVLYEKAFTIADETSTEPVPDKNTGNADGQIIYALQDDNSFGVTRYKLQYHQAGNYFSARFENKDVMGIGPFKAIYPNKMVINLIAVDCGENILLYISDDLDSVKFPGIKGQITDSITSRMEAIYKWFFKQF